jgi:hypothetical protein
MLVIRRTLAASVRETGLDRQLGWHSSCSRGAPQMAMTSAEFIRWSRLHEARAKSGVSSLVITMIAAAAFAALIHWRVQGATPGAASKTWLAGALAAFGLAFMRVPFHLYWRQDAALLAQLPIGGGPLFDAALLRCIRAAGATAVVTLAGAVPLAALAPELLARHAVMTVVLFTLAAGLLPAVATWAASLVSGSRDALELATALGGAPVTKSKQTAAPGSSSAILGALPGFASTVVIVFVIIAAPWLTGRETALPAIAVLVGLTAASALALVAMRAAAPRLMGTILRDVSALDRQRLATLEIRPPTGLESLVATLIGDAALIYRKDARLMRRRYPMAFALGALVFLVFAIVGLARPTDPMPWLVVMLGSAVVYGALLAGRLRRPPIEIPRLAATLPIPAAAIARAKLAWIVAWSLVFVGIPLAFAAARLL